MTASGQRRRPPRVAVGAWAPEYGSPVVSDISGADPGWADPVDASSSDVDPGREVDPADWRPLRPEPVSEPRLRFVDGVRRIDARLWLTDAQGVVRPGIAASYAAGAVCCDDEARIDSCAVRRVVLTGDSDPPDLAVPSVGTFVGESCDDASDAGLIAALQERMSRLEQLTAGEGEPHLTVMDGPLRTRAGGRRLVGYVKTHHAAYLAGTTADVVTDLTAGERTPLFRVTSGGGWSTWSWYLRLPADVDHPWEAVARCEVAGNLPLEAAVGLADQLTATLPRFAAVAYKDPRAPQNLYPIAALERRLRHRLGDAGLTVRGLRRAAALTGRPGTPG